MSKYFKNKKQKTKRKIQLAKPVDQVYMGDQFRPNTKHDRRVFNFFLAGGGLGDYINHMTAFTWIAEKNPQVMGRLFVKKPFLDVARYVMRGHDHWTVQDALDAEKYMKEGEPIYDPLRFTKQITAPGCHLMDLGFILYCNLNTPPQGYEFLVDLSGVYTNSDIVKDLEGVKYAVFTPGYTAESRRMKPGYFNELVRYTVDKGVTPVFLGKRNFAHQTDSDVRGYKASIDKDYDFSLGFDLTEQTTLLEAVEIINGAEFILGIDNGLLHFAGCTETPIIFGHTVTEIKHRDIRRRHGRTINISVDPKTLPCIGCQSKMRYILNHRFSKCIYGDYMCLDAIFSKECHAWKESINKILGV